MPRLTGVWKKPIPTLMHDSEGFEACMEEVTADVVERARTVPYRARGCSLSLSKESDFLGGPRLKTPRRLMRRQRSQTVTRTWVTSQRQGLRGLI